MEADLAGLHIASSRAYGTAGTTPFGTAGDYTDASNARKILVDNGAPTSDMHLVVNTAAGANLRGKQGGRGVDAEGDSRLLRQGVLLDVHGFALRESAQVITNTAGTGASYLINGTLAVGATTITVDTGSGTVLAGDIVTIAGDTNKYVVATALSGGSFTIGAPGLLKAPADNAAVTVVAAAARNMAFARSALILATRAPALPEGGDSAVDRTLITDPVSGITFELAMYAQYRQMQYELSAAWGVKCVKPEHTAILLG